MINILMYALAYFISAIPFGLVLAKFFANVDIRKSGSHSIGATNVLRVLKEQNPKLAKKIAIATIICDALKGILAILIAKIIFNCDENVLWTMAVLAVFGHCFSIYLGFNGGKGIATGAGLMLYFLPIELLISLLAWYVVGKIFKVSSLASLSAVITFITTSFIIHYNLEPINTHAPVLIICAIICYKHWPNILRFCQGKEGRVI